MNIGPWEKEYYELAAKYDGDDADWKTQKTLDYLALNLKLGEKILDFIA